MKKLILIPFLLFSTLCFASAPTRPFTYFSHAVIDPAQNNSNENTLYSYLQNGVDTFANGSITDISVSSTAAIAYSKLNLLNSIQGSDISTSAAIPYSKLNLTGSIVNADINASAAITDSKLATISTANKVNVTSLTGTIATSNLGSGTANSSTALFGDQTYKTVVDTNTSMFNISGAITASGSTQYTSFGGQTFTTTDIHDIPVPVSGTFRKLYVYTADTNNSTIVVTVRKNGSDTVLTTTLGSNATTGNDTTHTFTVVAGDRISVSVVSSRSQILTIGISCELALS